MKALILEDNKVLSESLKKLLSQQGWEVCAKISWDSASSLISAGRFDLIVLDILLPDKKGFDILKIFSEKDIKSKIALISGLFDESTVLNTIPEKLKTNCRFFKKPIDEKSFLEFVTKGSVKDSQDTIEPFLNFLYEKGASFKPLNFYFPEKEIFDSKKLIPLVFLAHLQKFTGDLEIKIDRGQTNLIQFFKGKIVKVLSSSSKSFLGELLVEHGLSLKEDIELFLSNREKTNKKIGEQLIEKGLLSPHMLSFILKEQVKIRLSEFMSQESFKLYIKEEKEMESLDDAEIDFNDIDFIEWLADSMQTELNTKFLDDLYFQIKNSLIYKNSQLNLASIQQKQFLKKYNSLFKKLEEAVSVRKFMQTLKSRRSALRYIYFGLLTNSIYLKQTVDLVTTDENLEDFLDDILSRSPENVYQVFGLPETASRLEIENQHKYLIQRAHPDSLPQDIDSFIREKAEKALVLITESYEILRSEDKLEEYKLEKSKDQFLTVIDQYEKGIKKVKEEDYKTAYSFFVRIKDHKQAPSNTILYLLWSKMKQESLDLIKNRSEVVQIQKEIEACSISLRTSSLFWFVKGLFCLKTCQYERAKELFTKTLMVQKDFAPAKKELITVKLKLKKEYKAGAKGFFGLFKKSS